MSLAVLQATAYLLTNINRHCTKSNIFKCLFFHRFSFGLGAALEIPKGLQYTQLFYGNAHFVHSASFFLVLHSFRLCHRSSVVCQQNFRIYSFVNRFLQLLTVITETTVMFIDSRFQSPTLCILSQFFVTFFVTLLLCLQMLAGQFLCGQYFKKFAKCLRGF